MISSGDISLPDYIDQIEHHFNDINPQIHAFIEEENRFDRLRKEAGELINKYPDPHKRPPLFGAIIGVKDIFHADGFNTQAGSNLPAEVLQGNEAKSVWLLKNAGALILGKTVTTEFAYFAPGPTKNPHNLEHTPGGSSSGSAAAVAAHLCTAALGTQTIGSIIRPASFCGVIGIKPSYDRISRTGVIPLSESLDHIGIFCNEIPTARTLLPVLIEDWSIPSEDIRKPVLGLPDNFYLKKADPTMQNHFMEDIEKLKSAGYKVVQLDVLDEFESLIERHNNIVAAEASRTHENWYRKYSEEYHPATKSLIEKGNNISSKDLNKLLYGRINLRKSISDAMHDLEVDVIICPSSVGEAPEGLSSTGDPIMNLPWTHAGIPAMNLPTGLGPNGLPLGIQLVSSWYQDEKLLGWAEMILEDLERM